MDAASTQRSCPSTITRARPSGGRSVRGFSASLSGTGTGAGAGGRPAGGGWPGAGGVGSAVLAGGDDGCNVAEPRHPERPKTATGANARAIERNEDVLMNL